MNLASERIGVEFTTKYGEQVIVIDYVNHEKVQVMFLDEHKWTTWTTWKTLKNTCGLASPFTRTVYGVGYLGTDYVSTLTREYKVWQNMLQRCYDGKERHKTYKNCTVCEQWHNFSQFLEDIVNIQGYDYWLNNPKQEIALDKDKYYAERGLITDSKIYSLETVRFINKDENMKEVSERTEPPCKPKQVKATHVETGQILEFESIVQASREIQSQGTDRTREKRISECLNGKGKSAYGYVWESIE